MIFPSKIVALLTARSLTLAKWRPFSTTGKKGVRAISHSPTIPTAKAIKKEVLSKIIIEMNVVKETLKGELFKEIVTSNRWIYGLMVTLIGAVVYAGRNLEDKLGKKIDKSVDKMEKSMDKLEVKMEKSMDKLEVKMEKSIDKLKADLEQQGQQITALAKKTKTTAYKLSDKITALDTKITQVLANGRENGGAHPSR